MDRAPIVAAEGSAERVAAPLPDALPDGIGSPRTVLAVCVCGLVALLNLYLTQPLLPLSERLFHAPKSVVGLTVSAATLGVAISAPLIGVLAERSDRRRMIVVSALALAAPTLLAAASPGLDTMIVWRFLQGLILPGVFGVMVAYIVEEWHGRALPIVMSLYVSSTRWVGCPGASSPEW